MSAGRKLVIVESPAKARTIAGYLGDDFDVEVPDAPKPKGSSKAKAKPKAAPKPRKDDDHHVVTDFLKSREGRATVNNVVRGVFDLLKKK